MHLSPAYQRDRAMKTYRGDPTLEGLANYLKQHVDVKFKMATKDLDQKVEMNRQIKEMMDS